MSVIEGQTYPDVLFHINTIIEEQTDNIQWIQTEKDTDRQTYRHTDRQTIYDEYRETDKDIDRQTDGHGQTDRHTW